MTSWYQRTLRWGQTNLTEIDPARYDAQWWREHWRRTAVQGVIINAGGIVAYYPSRYPLQHRAEHLGDRDLYGEIVAAARDEGLTVLARMDSNRADERVYHEHPDWFAVDADGRPYRAGPLYVACINGPYYRDFLPQVLTEIIERSHPDGITDNSWSGLERDRVCYCTACVIGFEKSTGQRLPHAVDWSDHRYRQWIEWSYQCRLDLWDLNNELTRRVGGPDCLWLGMNAGDQESQSRRLRDTAAICARSPILMLDSQYRRDGGFQANGDSGKLLHGLLGWDAVIPESTAMYDAGQPTFRLTSKPAAEARMWAVEGMAAGISPWWHHIGSVHEDRRQYDTAEPLFRWHAEHEPQLRDRQPLASVGVVWSRRNLDHFGRDEPTTRVVEPYRGTIDALIRHRIPYLPIEADQIEDAVERLAVLVLPNVGVLTDSQLEAVRRFVSAGGGLIASGESGAYDAWGERRADDLSDLLGVELTGRHHGGDDAPPTSWESWEAHSYLRFDADTAGDLVAGFDGTTLIGFGGRLEVVRPSEEAESAARWVPPFPIYPPETSWMRTPESDLPAVVTRAANGSGRVGYLAADLDRLFARFHHPDHGRLLANLVRWAADGRIDLEVDGPGVVDCHLHRQGDDLILHLVNLNQGGAWPGRLEELQPAGPYTVRIRAAAAEPRARLLVSGEPAEVAVADDWLQVAVPSILDHEVLLLQT